jgi:diguanylate cyclase (GGDEF)-like protein
MIAADWLRGLHRRFAAQRDSEYVQSLMRVAVVIGAVVYLFYLPLPVVPPPEHLLIGRRVVMLSLGASMALLCALVASPAPSVARRLLGICHDVLFLSCAMFLGEGAAAPFAALYLIVTLGNGFRFGIRYLYFAASLSIAAFGTVYLASDFWRQQGTLSVNIFMVLALVPFYLAGLLGRLHDARDQLRKQATHDSLTGMLNRAELESLVDTVMEHDTGNHALLFCDLDRFKNVNDEAGHAAGDKLLADVGAIVTKLIRTTDSCGRTGGDEFCVLLRHCSLDKAREIAEQIRSRVAGYRLAWGNEYFSVGISIGVAPTSAVRDATSLFRLADAACYAAKNAGRNKIHVVDPRCDSVDTGQVRRLFILTEDAGPPPGDKRTADG